MRNNPILGIDHRKSMRNAYIRKHFSFPISFYFNPVTNNHENMRNENENSSSREVWERLYSGIKKGFQPVEALLLVKVIASCQ